MILLTLSPLTFSCLLTECSSEQYSQPSYTVTALSLLVSLFNYVKSTLLLGVSGLYFTFSSYSKRAFIQVVFRALSLYTYNSDGTVNASLLELDAYRQDTGYAYLEIF